MITETLWAVAFVAKSVRKAIGLCYVVSTETDKVYKDSLTRHLKKRSESNTMREDKQSLLGSPLT